MDVTYKDLPALGVMLSPVYLRKKVRKGRFPKPIRGGYGGDGRFYWDRDEIVKWVKEQRRANPK